MINSPTFAPQQSRLFYVLAAIGLMVVGVGFLVSLDMEHRGHIITGMNNRIVWGLPHVFAIFLIVAASGVLNVASIGSVFGKQLYKARAPLSGLLSIAMLAGGLMVLVLDLGRPDRLIVAMTHYNFKSVFAWNIFLYNGLFVIVALYLWSLMERRMNVYSKPLGLVAFVWRIILTTGTGLIFGFLVGKQAYASALLAPMFIVLSFGWGLAVFLIVQNSMYFWNGYSLPPETLKRMKNLLGVFVAASLYFTIVYHLTNLYFAKQTAFEYFMLVDGGLYPLLLWGAYGFAGCLLPLALLYHPVTGKQAGSVVAACALIILGGIAHLAVLIIGGQAYPMELFPGYTTTSTLMDGMAVAYTPSLQESLLGIGGVGLAFFITVVGVRVFNFLPQDDFGAQPDRTPPTPQAHSPRSVS